LLRRTPKAWTYVPFNGGPRICVGQNFAMTEMAFARESSSLFSTNYSFQD
jgi:cytochrome P450